jgi:hypothetical protein
MTKRGSRDRRLAQVDRLIQIRLRPRPLQPDPQHDAQVDQGRGQVGVIARSGRYFRPPHADRFVQIRPCAPARSNRTCNARRRLDSLAARSG